MRYFDVKNAIVVLGVTLYCLACIANVDETSPLSFLHAIYAPCLYTLYLFGALLLHTYRDRLELGHEVYLLFCLYIFMSSLWSDHPWEVVGHYGAQRGLVFLCVSRSAMQSAIITFIYLDRLLHIKRHIRIVCFFSSSYAGHRNNL